MNHHRNRPKAYLFDYGGTLDTGGHHWGRVLWKAWQRAGIPVGEELFRQAYVHGERTLGQGNIIRPETTFRETLSAKLQLEMELAGCMEYHDRVLEDVYTQAREHTVRSREVLARLGKDCRLALVSNFYGNLTTVLKEMGLDGLFCDVVESAVVGIRKPDPEIYRLALARTGLTAGDVVVVGDSLKNDIRPARQLGCTTVWLKGEQWTDEPNGEAMADRTIGQLAELLSQE